MTEQTILDMCCGSRMFWFNKRDTRAVFADIRAEEHKLCDGRRLIISPDLVADFRALPFADASFPVVVFDPPHLERVGQTAWMGKKYGRLNKKTWRETYGAGSNVMLPAEEAEELARIALAVMDGEPVALQPELAKVIYHFRDWNEGFPVERFKADYVISWMLANYPPAQPAKDREQVRSEHAEWSQATFGNVGPVGPLKHLSKEALEAAEQPGDLSEWADMQFLLWDAQRRAGITDDQITQAMIDKLAVNKQRSWPEPKDGEPRLHIKEQPRKKVDRCNVCTEGARGGCGTCIFNGNFE